MRHQATTAGAPVEYLGEGVLLECAEQAVTAKAGRGQGGTGEAAEEAGLLAQLAKGSGVRVA